jgi:hypothetical protein
MAVCKGASALDTEIPPDGKVATTGRKVSVGHTHRE